MTKKAIILLSGGLDSTTVLAIAKNLGYENYALSFSYGQRHNVELESAKKIAEKFAVKEDDIQIINENTKLSQNLTLLKTSNLSEKEILNYLINETSKLSGFHKLNIVESYQNDIMAKDEKLDIELKDLYKKLIREDYNGIYNAPITTISKIISVSSVQNKIDMILNELYIYNYIPQVRLFLENNIGGVKSDNDKYLGQSSKVYSIVDFTDNGQIVFIGED
jgi:hypothetical protein